jgi:hypothetical protein
MSKTTVQGTVELDTDKKKLEWESSLYSLSIVFASELNTGLGRTGQYMDMAATVNTLLGNDMSPPTDRKLSESWYYIASWLIFSMRKASKRRVGDVQRALELLVRTASMTKEEAMEDSSLPTGRNVTEERYGGFTYASSSFFQFFVKLETLYETLLVDGMVKIWGSMLIEFIKDGILDSDLSIVEFLPDYESDEDTCRSIFHILLLTYGHLRGKDYMKRKNALMRGNVTVGHRQTIATLANGKLRAKGEKNTKQEEATDAPANGEAADTDDGMDSNQTAPPDMESAIEEATTAALCEFDAMEEEENEDEDA